MISDTTVLKFGNDTLEVAARRLWQTLFNFYCANKCPLDHMDNMLIDLANCENIREASLSRGDSVKFLWGCDPDHYRTTWIDEPQWYGLGPNLVADIAGFDRFLLCEVSENEAKVSVLDKTKTYDSSAV